MYYDIFYNSYYRMIIVGDEDGISELLIDRDIPENHIKSEDYFIEAKYQLEEYFRGERKEFHLKLNPRGTDFQLKVWDELKNIPYGETRSYKEIAIAIGNPKASRAIGMANNKNPIPIIIPCHRVIGSNKTLVGYAGGLKMKKDLLNLETINSIFRNLE